MKLIPLLLAVFIDSLGFGLVFPIFSPLIVNNETGIFDPEVSLSLRGLFFGLLVSAYCVGQFFGGPVLGALSDRMGRRKVLVGAMWLAFVGYQLACFGVIFESVWVLFLSRLMTGVSAGSFAVAQSAVADLTTDEKKNHHFGLVGMSYWTGFIVGPYFGGKLGEMGFTIPFAVAALCCLLSALLLLFKFRESHFGRGISLPALGGNRPWLHGVTNIGKALLFPKLRLLFLLMFIISLGWGFFTEFSPIFLTRQIGLNMGQIANFYAWIGFWIALSQGALIRLFVPDIPPERLFSWGLCGFVFFLPVMLFFNGLVGFFWLIPFIAFSQALIFPSAATLVSLSSPKEMQGEMLGVYNSVQSAAIALPPLFSGSIVVLFPHLAVTVGAFCMGVALLIAILNYKSFKNRSAS